MIRAATFVALMLSAAPSAGAVELKVVTAFTPVMMEQIYRTQRDEAEAMFVDSTILGKVGAIDEGLAERLLMSLHLVRRLEEEGTCGRLLRRFCTSWLEHRTALVVGMSAAGHVGPSA